ncbi:MAG: hypothetical protein HYY57_05220 [Candidatus Omnitrophica bacterium]|nr:hypothetical protein [Candidatus Omnitrophota bacterium]
MTYNKFVWMIIFALGPAHEVYAYVDPGSGSLLFQLLIAGILGAALTVKSWWRKVRNVFTQRDTQEK